MTATKISVEGAEKVLPLKSTSAIVWAMSFAVLLVVLLLRSGQLYEEVAAQVSLTDAAQALDDAAMGKLAVSLGFYLGLVLSMLVTALYFSLASVLESKVFPGLSVSRGRLRLGFLAVIAILATLPVQFAAWLLSVESPKDHWLFYVYLCLISIAVPIAYRQLWHGLSRKRVRIIFCASIFITGLSVLL